MFGVFYHVSEEYGFSNRELLFVTHDLKFAEDFCETATLEAMEAKEVHFNKFLFESYEEYIDKLKSILKSDPNRAEDNSYADFAYFAEQVEVR